MRKRTVLPTKVKENLKEVISMFKNKKKILVVLLLLISAALLVGFDGQPVWGSPSLPVWYYGELVPFGELLAKGIEPHCHDGLGPGVITCYDTNEELAAATGIDLAGTDPEVVERLRQEMAQEAKPTPEPTPVWGNPSRPVWYYGELVPFGELLAKGIEPHCHDGLGSGVITCYDTNEELAAATGIDLPGVDKAAVQHLRTTGAVSQVLCNYYSIVYEHINYGGRNFALCYDYNDFRSINFNDITSSIYIPYGAGYSTYFQHINYGGDKRSFNSSVSDLRDYDFNDVISSAYKGL